MCETTASADFADHARELESTQASRLVSVEDIRERGKEKAGSFEGTLPRFFSLCSDCLCSQWNRPTLPGG